MTKSLYIASLEPNSGKLVVTSGTMEILSRQVERLGFFRVIVPGSAEEDRHIRLLSSRFNLSLTPDKMVGVTLKQLKMDLLAVLVNRVTPDILDDAEEELQKAFGSKIVIDLLPKVDAEIPIEKIAVAQKTITARANFFGVPVITATQMLESMTGNHRPTRAESTDVANAILGGTDAVMLSEESAMGDYPLESVQMLAKIAIATEPHRLSSHFDLVLKPQAINYKPTAVDFLAFSIENIITKVESPGAVFAPTTSGYMARSLTRFRLPVWIVAISSVVKTCQDLLFSYGVYPIHEKNKPKDWTVCARDFARGYDFKGTWFIKAEGPSSDHPDINHKMEIIEL